MAAIRADQRKKIYAIGQKLGICDKLDPTGDDLHALIYAITGKQHIGQLTDDEAGAVIYSLSLKQGPRHPSDCAPTPKQPGGYNQDYVRGGVTKKQRDMVWALMYRLQEADPKINRSELGPVLCAIIKKNYGIDAKPKNPLIWLNYRQCCWLIETLKKIVDHARQRKVGDGSE